MMGQMHTHSQKKSIFQNLDAAADRKKYMMKTHLLQFHSRIFDIQGQHCFLMPEFITYRVMAEKGDANAINSQLWHHKHFPRRKYYSTKCMLLSSSAVYNQFVFIHKNYWEHFVSSLQYSILFPSAVTFWLIYMFFN